MRSQGRSALSLHPPPLCPPLSCSRDADRVAGLLEANNIYNTKLLVNRVRPDMIQKNDMMSVRDVQVGKQGLASSDPGAVPSSGNGTAARTRRIGLGA